MEIHIYKLYIIPVGKTCRHLEFNYNGNMTYRRIYGKWRKKRIFRWVLYGLCSRIDAWRCISCIIIILGPPILAGPPRESKKRFFRNFESLFSRILMSRTKTDAGFGISGKKIVKTNHQTLCSSWWANFVDQWIIIFLFVIIY